jgi:hypothetical protein
MQLAANRFIRISFALGVLGALFLTSVARAEEENENEPAQPQLRVDAAGTLAEPTAVDAAATAVVNFKELSLQPPVVPQSAGPVKTWMPPEHEPPAEPYFPPAPAGPAGGGLRQIMTPSPGPSSSFMGLDDIAMVDSLYIVIPPDIGGAVGPDKIMEGFNNNYRIRDKATGTTLFTLGTATFWAPVVAVAERASLTDPRTLYDPYNNRWITVMQTYTSSAGKILVGVSLTSDPSGSWYLYNFATTNTLDFPDIGFNKNWISIAINRYSALGSFQRGINLAVNYPSARAGTGTGTLFTLASGTHFSFAPCVTYSSTSDTLYVVGHLSGPGATYQLDTITGTAAAPVYTSGGTLTRPGGGWTQPSGNQLPQSAPVSGASACGATPCKIESGDSYLRSAPTYRGGKIWYTQTVGLPTGTLTHTAVQWTKISAPGGAYVDGGRVEDPTATATNGGKWYAFSHIAVNSLGDFIVGYTQFSSAQHPSAGYSIHMAAEGAGTIREPLVYHAGEDYYHKTFDTTTGRNRWGDFSTAQVDPTDDQTLWTIQEYGKTRPGTDDGNTGSNSSRWSSWWAGVTTVTTYTITASAGAGGSINPSGAVTVPSGGNQTLTITPAACYHVADVLVDGGSVGAVTSYTFTNVTSNHTISAGFAINTYTITASAGPGGSISPNGGASVNCGANQAFTITPGTCYDVADVLVDGGSVGAVTAYTFTNVQANHTIAASFVLKTYTITSSAGPGGSINPSGAVGVNCGANKVFNITPDPCYDLLRVMVDGSSVGALLSYEFTNVAANHTIEAIFVLKTSTIAASASPGGTIDPTGDVTVDCGTNKTFNIIPDPCYIIAGVLVDGNSVGAVPSYEFTNVTGNHTIVASFVIRTFTLETSVIGGGSLAIAKSLDTYDCGASVQISALADPGWQFDHWAGSATGSDNPLTVVMDANKSITAVFVDIAPPEATLTSPNGGEVWNYGENQPITWTATDNVGVTTVDLVYSTDGGATYPNVIATGLANTGSYLWAVPNVYTLTARVRVTAHDAAAHATADDSDADFEIDIPASAVADILLGPGDVLGVYPNPTYAGANILYRIPQVTSVEVNVYDVTGQLVRKIASGAFPGGARMVKWDGRGESGKQVSAGIYLVRLMASSGAHQTKRLVLLR